MIFEEIWGALETNKVKILVNSLQGEFIYRAASGKKNIVEIGTWRGGTAAILGAAGKNVYTIDDYSYSDIQQTSPEEVKENLKKVGIKNIKVFIGKSHEWALKWKMPIDLLFIDGDHQYESVKQDIEDWLPHVIFGGSIIFDDYSSLKATVGRAADEAVDAGFLKMIGGVNASASVLAKKL